MGCGKSMCKSAGLRKEQVHVENLQRFSITDSQRECVEEEIQGPGLRFCPVGWERIRGFKGQ